LCRNYISISTRTLFISKSFSFWVPMSQSLDTNANLAIRPKTTVSSMLTFIAVIHKNKWCINFSLLLVFLNTVNTADAQSRYISCCPSCSSMRVRKIVRNKNTLIWQAVTVSIVQAAFSYVYLHVTFTSQIKYISAFLLCTFTDQHAVRSFVCEELEVLWNKWRWRNTNLYWRLFGRNEK
jgi:hypothetical protein